jgi:hypothetical protein
MTTTTTQPTTTPDERIAALDEKLTALENDVVELVALVADTRRAVMAAAKCSTAVGDALVADLSPSDDLESGVES